MADDQGRDEATKLDQTFHRHEQRTENWEEAEPKTDRPNDTPLRGEDKPAVPNSTLASRAKARQGSKKVSKDTAEVEDKKVTRAAKKKS